MRRWACARRETITMGSGMAMTKRDSNQRAAMRNAPSRRMVSPLSMVFSQMCFTSAANSAGRPRRDGKGTLLPRASCTSGVKDSHHRRFEDSRRDGDDANAEARQLARDGQRERNHSAFRCGVGGLANLAIKRGDGCGVDDDAALAVFVGIFFGDGVCREADHIECPDEIDVHGAREGLKAVRPFAACDFFCGRDAGAVHQSVQVAEGAEREIDGGLAVAFAGDVSQREANASRQALGARSSPAEAIQVGDDDRCRLQRRAAGRRLRRGPMRRR